HHIGVMPRAHRHAVSAAGLARDDGSVYPPLREEVLNQRSSSLRESVIRAGHELLRVIPREVTRGVADRCVAVPLVKVADAEQLLLDPVIADGDVVAAGHSLDKR